MRKVRRTKRRIKRIVSAVIVLAVIVMIAKNGDLEFDDFTEGNGTYTGEYEDTTDTSDGDTSDIEVSNADTDIDTSDDEEEPFTEDGDGDFYTIVGEAEIDTSAVEIGEVIYSDLDELGRTEIMVSCVTYDMMIEGLESERGDISDIYPTGWTTNEQLTITYEDGESETTWVLNRSHLLADSLGGEEEIENLITGTRPQNVGESGEGGMAYSETMIRDWLYDNEDGYVYYTVDPVYEGDDLMAKTVEVNVLSSDGELDEQIIVYNTLPGYTIDYATGEYYEE